MDAAARGLWPTPKASPSGPDYARAGRDGSGGDDLATAVARDEHRQDGREMVPTPTKADSHGSGRRRPRDGREDAPADSLRDHVGAKLDETGQLNPSWVEWLMGYPDGYTDPEVPNAEMPEFEGWDAERLPRVAPKVPNRRQRLAALGDSVVPQVVAAWAGRLR